MTPQPQAATLLQKRLQWLQIRRSERQPELRVALLGTFTLDLLEPYLGMALEAEGLPADVWVGPYNQVLQECLTSGSRTEAYGPDVVVVSPRLEELWSGRPLPMLPSADVDYHREALQMAETCLSAVERWGARLCFVLPPVPDERPLGCGDAGDPGGVGATAAAVREALRRRLSSKPGVLVADLDTLVRRLGSERAMNPAMLVFGHIPFSDELFAQLGEELARLIALGSGFGRCLAVLDGDGVLWGGSLADAGADGVDLAAGGPGLAHLQLQEHLLERRRTGLRLAAAVRGDQGALEALLARPDMRLRRCHLEAVDAEEGEADAAAQVQRLVQACGVGLDETIWVSAHAERLRRVAGELPEVAVVAVPEDIARWRLELPSARLLDRLPAPSPQVAVDGGDVLGLEDFLAGLRLTVEFEELASDDAQAVVDLQQKISEFNLAGCPRSLEETARDLADVRRVRILAVKVRDRFDDYGVAGLLRTERRDDALEIDTLALNCRVLGKRVEAFVVERMAMDAEAAGLERLRLRYRPTDRNGVVLDWLQKLDAEGLRPTDDGGMALEISLEQARAWASGQREVFAREETVAEVPASEAPCAQSPAEPRDAETPPTPPVAPVWLRARPSAELPTDADAVLHLMRAEKRAFRAEAGASGPVSYGSATEELLASIWSEILDRSAVSAHDHFFRLGGHSMLATRILSRVRDAFGVELPLKTLFTAPTVAQMAACIEAARRAGAVTTSPPLRPVPRDGDLPLSFAQRRLFTLDRLEPGSTRYHMQVGLRLRGELDQLALEEALARMVRRHESLRTLFVGGADGEPAQRVLPSLVASVASADLAREIDATVAIRTLADEQMRPAFDLATGPLFRLALGRLGDRDQALVLTLHHIIGDVWSMGVFFEELMAEYQAVHRGEPSPLPDLPIQVPDYAVWQRQWMQGEVLDSHLEFWRRSLADAPTVLELPVDRPRPDQLGGSNGRIGLDLSVELTERLRQLGYRQGATLFMTLFAAFATLLSRWSRQDDLLVGMPIANRNRAELERLIGFIANTLVLRADLRGDPTFATVIHRVRGFVLDAADHQDMPFETLVKALAPARDPGRNPLFQVMFAYHNVPSPRLEQAGLTVEGVDLDRSLNPFDMFLHMWESREGGGHLAGSLSFSLDLFEEATARRLIEDFVRVLEMVTSSAEIPLARLFEGHPEPPGGVRESFRPASPPPVRDAPYVAPRNDLEHTLVRVWEEVLQRDRLGVDDNFFFVGGDSILALRAVEGARQAGLTLVPKQLMRHQTVARLAAAIASGDQTPTAPQGRAAGAVTLSPSQCFFFQLDLPNRDHFNQVLYGEIGEAETSRKLDPEVLCKAFAALVDHHDALHLRFQRLDGSWACRYAEGAERSYDCLEIVDLRSVSADRLEKITASTEARVHRSIRLAEGPLLLAVLFRMPDGRRDRLLLVAHHIVVDAVSWAILLGDLEALLDQIGAGGDPVLPPRTASFQSWTDTLVRATGSPELRAERHFWCDQPWQTASRLPVDHPGGANLERHVTLVSRTVSPRATAALLRRAGERPDLDITDLLLAAVVESFGDWTGRRVLSVGLTRNGRHLPWEDLDLSRTVGWLVHIFPVLLDLGDSRDLWQAAQRVHRHLLAVPNQGLGFGMLRFLSSDPEVRQEMATIPMPQLLFNYFGRLEAAGNGRKLLTPIDRGRPEIHDPEGVREFQVIVNSLVDGDRLRFNCTFSDQVYDPSSLSGRLDRMVELLEELVARVHPETAEEQPPAGIASGG